MEEYWIKGAFHYSLSELQLEKNIDVHMHKIYCNSRQIVDLGNGLFIAAADVQL